jgi:hypothetical protein
MRGPHDIQPELRSGGEPLSVHHKHHVGIQGGPPVLGLYRYSPPFQIVDSITNSNNS